MTSSDIRTTTPARNTWSPSAGREDRRCGVPDHERHVAVPSGVVDGLLAFDQKVQRFNRWTTKPPDLGYCVTANGA
jgi:hypothetical protein